MTVPAPPAYSGWQRSIHKRQGRLSYTEIVAEFKCGLVKEKLTGSLIAVASPLDTRTKTFALAIRQSSFAQLPAEYETEAGGKVVAALACTRGSLPVEKCGLETTGTVLALSGEEGAIEA